MSPAAVAAAQRPSMLLPEGMSPLPEVSFAGYGFGWLSGTFRGRKLVWHNGGVDGFATQTLLLPDDRLGVVASANLHMSNLPMAVVFEVADALLGTGDETGWYDRLRPGAPEGADEDPAAVPQQTAPPAPPAPPSHPLSAYAGTYRDAGYGELVVAVAGETLAVRIGDFDVEARRRRFDTWDLHYDPLEVDVLLTFVTDADGVVTEAWAPLDPSFPPVRFGRQTQEDSR